MAVLDQAMPKISGQLPHILNTAGEVPASLSPSLLGLPQPGKPLLTRSLLLVEALFKGLRTLKWSYEARKGTCKGNRSFSSAHTYTTSDI